MIDPLLATLIALLLAYLLSEIFRYFSLPRVVGQILAGIILGIPIIKNLFFPEHIISIFSFISNIGIILLFFFIGLEINLGQFKRNFKETSLIAIFNTVIPLVAGFLIGKFLFGFSTMASVIIGISVSVSSQAISLDILEEMKLLKSKIGNLIISSGTVDDVFELLLISAILVSLHSTILGEISLLKLAMNLGIFLLIIVVARFALIPLALRALENEKSKSTLFMGSLIIVLLMAYLSELYGVGSLIGALIAGIMVRQTLLTGNHRKPWEKNEISHSIHIISFGFLIPIFFVTVGLNFDINVLSSNLFLVFVLILVDIFGTLIGTIMGVLFSKGTVSEGLVVGFGVLPKGDTELVIATLALGAGMINQAIFTAIITVALFSTFFAPILFKMLPKKYIKVHKSEDG